MAKTSIQCCTRARIINRKSRYRYTSTNACAFSLCVWHEPAARPGREKVQNNHSNPYDECATRYRPDDGVKSLSSKPSTSARTIIGYCGGEYTYAAVGLRQRFSPPCRRDGCSDALLLHGQLTTTRDTRSRLVESQWTNSKTMTSIVFVTAVAGTWSPKHYYDYRYYYYY